jgi:hypothetical protein
MLSLLAARATTPDFNPPSTSSTTTLVGGKGTDWFVVNLLDRFDLKTGEQKLDL